MPIKIFLSFSGGGLIGGVIASMAMAAGLSGVRSIFYGALVCAGVSLIALGANRP